jgi:arabinose-5-phosphate isomerase
VLDIEREGLAAVRDRLGDAFEGAVNRMLACLAKGGKIAVSGVGKNYHIAQKISATLASTGSTSVILNPMQAMHGDLGILSSGDVLLVLSYSGESEELLSLVPIVRRLGVDVIAMTGSEDSPLARLSDVAIPIAVPREACPFNMAPTASTTAALAVGDALSMVLLEARGFKIEDYAKLHPGGTIGRTLLLRVADIMRTGDRLATIGESALVKDAVVAMTKARAGSACIVDGQGSLLGILTDGDLRRNMPSHPNLLDLPVARIMTRKPIRVSVDQLAVDVLKVFETYEVDDLPVVDDSGRLAGLVDSKDLPRFKLM